jgi:hypothetical protein
VVTSVTVIGHGFPAGTIRPAKVNVILTPSAGASLPSGTTTAAKVQVVSGTTERISFTVPKSISVPAAALYQVSIAGTTATGIAFQSSNAASLTVNALVAITTSSPLPTGTVGVAYSQTLSARGGTGQYTWSLSSGSLPGGLSLNPATGQIGGQPSTLGMFYCLVKATDSGHSSTSKTLALSIDPPLVISTSSPLPAGTVSVAYAQTLTATGGSGQYTWSVAAGVLPSGLSLTPANGLIAGLPTTAATSNFTMGVTDTNQAVASQPFALTIDSPAQLQTLAPDTANAGVSLQVSITGSNTHFVQGTTLASFGPGISVGTAAAGQPGSVTVTGPTKAIAQIAIRASATVESQTVTVTTGAEHATLVSGFTIGAAIPVISVNTAATAPLAAGFSGFDDEYLIDGVEYWDPKYIAMVEPLKPGWIRFPSGTPSMAFDWQLSHMNLSWLGDLSPLIGAYFASALQDGQMLTQAKGGASFAKYGTLLQTVGANGLVVFNGYTDDRTDSAYAMAATALANGIKVIDWELDNEPYVFPTIYPKPAEYASAMYNPYYTNIIAADPSATAGVFYQGEFNWQQGNYVAWDNGMAAYSPQYWNAVSFHVYPITDTGIATAAEEQTLNGILAHGTTEYFSSYIEPLIGPSMPVFISELNSGVATMEFETYIYNAIFLAEYIARMSTIPQVKAIGVSELYLGNSYNEGVIRAVDDYESYLLAQVAANPDYSTDTSTNPNTQFSFYYSTNALALEIANQAINGSNATWPTAVYGSPTVPILGYDGSPVPAVFAQGYQGTDGTHYLLITNKSGSSLPVAIEDEGLLLDQTVTITYISSTSDTAQNTATGQDNVQIATTTSGNPVTIGPYSVTRVQW